MPLICPACRKIYLKPYTDPGTGLEIDSCPKCWGLWFDSNELAQFFKSGALKNRFYLIEESKPLESTGYTISTRARACPRCKIAMSEKLFGDVSIDICPTCHGIWLDDGELQRIVIQFKKGARNENTVSGELSKGLMGEDGNAPNLGEVVTVVMAYLKSLVGGK